MKRTLGMLFEFILNKKKRWDKDRFLKSIKLIDGKKYSLRIYGYICRKVVRKGIHCMLKR